MNSLVLPLCKLRVHSPDLLLQIRILLHKLLEVLVELVKVFFPQLGRLSLVEAELRIFLN